MPARALPRLAAAGALLGGAVTSIYVAVEVMPLANVIAIFFVEPLVLTLFSALFLGERVGRHRLAAVVVGLAGAMVVVRPAWAAFGWASVMPLAAAAFFAGHLIILRSSTATLDGLRLQTIAGVFAALALGLAVIAGTAADVAPLRWRPLAADGAVLGLIVLSGVLSAAAQLMIAAAFRRAQASLLAPLQYLEILSATLFGFLVFGHFPDALTWLGTAIILGSGLYVIHRERRLGRRPKAMQLPP